MEGALGDPLLGTFSVPPVWHQPRGLQGFSRAIKAFFFRKVPVVTCPRGCHHPWLTLAHSPAQSGGPWWPLPVPSPPHTREAGGGWCIYWDPELAGKLRHRKSRDPLVPWGAGASEGLGDGKGKGRDEKEGRKQVGREERRERRDKGCREEKNG